MHVHTQFGILQKTAIFESKQEYLSKAESFRNLSKAIIFENNRINRNLSKAAICWSKQEPQRAHSIVRKIQSIDGKRVTKQSLYHLQRCQTCGLPSWSNCVMCRWMVLQSNDSFGGMTLDAFRYLHVAILILWNLLFLHCQSKHLLKSKPRC